MGKEQVGDNETNGSRTTQLQEKRKSSATTTIGSRFALLRNLDEETWQEDVAQVIVNKIKSITGPETYTIYSGLSYAQKGASSSKKPPQAKKSGVINVIGLKATIEVALSKPSGSGQGLQEKEANQNMARREQIFPQPRKRKD